MAEARSSISSTDLMSPDSASWAERRRSVVGFGAILIVCGTLFNEWMLAKALSPDGVIDSRTLRLVIWMLELITLGTGFVLVKFPIAAGRRLSGVLSGLSALALSLFSLLLTSIGLFAMLEAFPSLISTVHLSGVRYYAYTERYVADEQLVFRYRRPVVTFWEGAAQYKGDQYDSSYGEVEPIKENVHAVYDEDGFRNSPSTSRPDIVMMGDSLLEAGYDEADTFAKRLEGKSGLTTRNFGLAGYGPFQYLEILKRWGVGQQPKVALFCFFEGNDIEDVKQYMAWERGDTYNRFELFTRPPRDFVQRYFVAGGDLVRFISQGGKAQGKGTINHKVGQLHVGEISTRMAFSYLLDPRLPDQLATLPEWQRLTEILVEFKDVAEKHNMVPMIVYIPDKAHIYADYTSPTQSETAWLAIREQQIAAKSNIETTLAHISRRVGLTMISLTPAFEQAASQGQLLFHPFDTHWNSEGRRIAAEVVAEHLKQAIDAPGIR